MRKLLVSLVAVSYLTSLLSGCTGQPTKQIFSESLTPDIHGIAVSAVLVTPNIDIEVPTRSKAEGLGEGAGAGGLTGAAIGMEVAVETGPVGILLAPYLIGIGTVIGTVTGGVYGVAASESAKTVAHAEAKIHSATSGVPLQQRLQGEVADLIARQTHRPTHLIPIVSLEDASATPTYQDPGLPDIDTILELRITDIHSEGGRIGRPVSIVLRVQTRILRAATGEVLARDTYQFTSYARKLKAWAANDTEAVYLAYDRALHGIANEIVHENFLLYAVPRSLIPETPGAVPESASPKETYDKAATITSMGEATKPVAWKPKWDGSYQVELVKPVAKPLFTAAKVKTLTPRFRWKAFPREIDRERDPQRVIAGIDTVVYDLEIYNVTGDKPREAVYSRYGLTDTDYTMDSALEPCREYAWSVRARFNMGPYMRSTDWAINDPFGQSARYARSLYRHPSEVARENSGDSIFHPMSRFHKFKTPCHP